MNDNQKLEKHVKAALQCLYIICVSDVSLEILLPNVTFTSISHHTLQESKAATSPK